MGKKKARKSCRINTNNFITIALIVISICILTIMPMVKSVTEAFSNTTVTYKGIGMIIGGNVDVESTSILVNNKVITDSYLIESNFNLNAFSIVLLNLISIIIIFAVTYLKSIRKNKILPVIASILLVISAIMTLTIKNSAVKALGFEYAKDYFSLGYGSIISAIIMFSIAIINLLFIFYKKRK